MTVAALNYLQTQGKSKKKLKDIVRKTKKAIAKRKVIICKHYMNFLIFTYNLHESFILLCELLYTSHKAQV